MATHQAVNLGQVAAVMVGTSEPSVKTILWYDTSDSLMKYWNGAGWSAFSESFTSGTNIGGADGNIFVEGTTGPTLKFRTLKSLSSDLVIETNGDVVTFKMRPSLTIYPPVVTFEHDDVNVFSNLIQVTSNLEWAIDYGGQTPTWFLLVDENDQPLSSPQKDDRNFRVKILSANPNQVTERSHRITLKGDGKSVVLDVVQKTTNTQNFIQLVAPSPPNPKSILWDETTQLNYYVQVFDRGGNNDFTIDNYLNLSTGGVGGFIVYKTSSSSFYVQPSSNMEEVKNEITITLIHPSDSSLTLPVTIIQDAHPSYGFHDLYGTRHVGLEPQKDLYDGTDDLVISLGNF